MVEVHWAAEVRHMAAVALPPPPLMAAPRRSPPTAVAVNPLLVVDNLPLAVAPTMPVSRSCRLADREPSTSR